MHARTATTALLTALLASCSSEPPPPTYTVVNQGERQIEQGTTGWAELHMPDTTADQAQDAIRAYGKTITGHATMYEIAVIHDTTTTVHGRPATTYVCMGRWVKNTHAAQTWTDGSITSTTWPAIRMNCPSR
ncbi:hypothetical protein ACTFBT_16165 [Streptomyces microflavus]|uniref:hypothetical protein n=1 Tax=Streptomyces TaxID=1883 RepID=UPI0005169FDE|nr:MULTISPECIES: hypothetical protein [Streptomyces]MDX2981221.1 hypothetical protein [Streptomyces sp. NRRL_B-2249]